MSKKNKKEDFKRKSKKQVSEYESESESESIDINALRNKIKNLNNNKKNSNKKKRKVNKTKFSSETESDRNFDSESDNDSDSDSESRKVNQAEGERGEQPSQMQQLLLYFMSNPEALPKIIDNIHTTIDNFTDSLNPTNLFNRKRPCNIQKYFSNVNLVLKYIEMLKIIELKYKQTLEFKCSSDDFDLDVEAKYFNDHLNKIWDMVKLILCELSALKLNKFTCSVPQCGDINFDSSDLFIRSTKDYRKALQKIGFATLSNGDVNNTKIILDKECTKILLINTILEHQRMMIYGFRSYMQTSYNSFKDSLNSNCSDTTNIKNIWNAINNAVNVGVNFNDIKNSLTYENNKTYDFQVSQIGADASTTLHNKKGLTVKTFTTANGTAGSNGGITASFNIDTNATGGISKLHVVNTGTGYLVGNTITITVVNDGTTDQTLDTPIIVTVGANQLNGSKLNSDKQDKMYALNDALKEVSSFKINDIMNNFEEVVEKSYQFTEALKVGSHYALGIKYGNNFNEESSTYTAEKLFGSFYIVQQLNLSNTMNTLIIDTFKNLLEKYKNSFTDSTYSISLEGIRSLSSCDNLSEKIHLSSYNPLNYNNAGTTQPINLEGTDGKIQRSEYSDALSEIWGSNTKYSELLKISYQTNAEFKTSLTEKADKDVLIVRRQKLINFLKQLENDTNLSLSFFGEMASSYNTTTDDKTLNAPPEVFNNIFGHNHYYRGTNNPNTSYNPNSNNSPNQRGGFPMPNFANFANQQSNEQEQPNNNYQPQNSQPQMPTPDTKRSNDILDDSCEDYDDTTDEDDEMDTRNENLNFKVKEPIKKPIKKNRNTRSSFRKKYTGSKKNYL